MFKQRHARTAMQMTVLTGPHPPSNASPLLPANIEEGCPSCTSISCGHTTVDSGHRMPSGPQSHFCLFPILCPRPLSHGNACCPCHLFSQLCVSQDGSYSAVVTGSSISVPLACPHSSSPFLSKLSSATDPGVKPSPPTYSSDYPPVSSEGFYRITSLGSPALPYTARC